MKVSVNKLLAFSSFFLITNLVWSQKFDPSTGNTYYPNGTAYLSNVNGFGQGPVVVGPENAEGNHEAVDCTENPERCRELLEEAADDADKGGGAQEPGDTGGSTGDSGSTGSGGGKEDSSASSESLPGEYQNQFRYYISKYKIKPGVWYVAKGRWSFVSNHTAWTKRIFRSLK